MVAARELGPLVSLAELWRDSHIRTIVLSAILLRTIGLSKTRRRTLVPTWLGESDARALSGGNPDGT